MLRQMKIDIREFLDGLFALRIGFIVLCALGVSCVGVLPGAIKREYGTWMRLNEVKTILSPLHPEARRFCQEAEERRRERADEYQREHYSD
jgi:hypothetical protein